MTIALWVLAGLVLLCGLLLFLLAPRPRREGGIAPLLGWDYAHRGLFDNESGPPENSLPAFARAVEGGYGIELDVQLSRDGKLVVFHDDDLARMCSAEGRVDSYSYEELREMPLLGSGERIPLFTEVLELVAGRVPLIVELKMSPVNNYPVCEAANRILSGYRGVYCVESFSPLAVRWYRKHRPDVVRGQLSDRMRAKEGGLAARLACFGVRNLLTNGAARPDFIAYCHSDAHQIGFRLCRGLFHPLTVAWTIRSQAEYDRAGRLFELKIFEGFRPEN